VVSARTSTSGNFPEVRPGLETRDIAAPEGRVRNAKTYEQARKVVEHAVDEVVAQMLGRLSIMLRFWIAEAPAQNATRNRATAEDEKRLPCAVCAARILRYAGGSRERRLDSAWQFWNRNLELSTAHARIHRPLVERNYAAWP